MASLFDLIAVFSVSSALVLDSAFEELRGGGAATVSAYIGDTDRYVDGRDRL